MEGRREFHLRTLILDEPNKKKTKQPNQLHFNQRPMPASRFRSLIDMLFPSSDETIERSQFVQESLRSLRMVRDERALLMGSTKRIPSRYELRINPEQFDQLKGMHAISDLEVFLTNQLMKESSAGEMRTFGDHLLRVTIACDDALTSGEMYTAVLTPETKPPASPHLTAHPAPHRTAHQPIGGAFANDATRVLGEVESRSESPSERQRESLPTPAQPPPPSPWRIVVEWEGEVIANAQLPQGFWIIGRRGNPRPALPQNHHSLELDLRETVSRHQLRLEVHDDWVVVEQIGKGRVSVGQNDPLRPGFPRTMLPGTELQVEGYTIRLLQ